MSPQAFDRIVVVDAGRSDEVAGPALRDHVGLQLRAQAESEGNLWLEVPEPPAEAEALLTVVDRALHAQLTRPVTDEGGWEAFAYFSRRTADMILEQLDEQRTWVYLRGPSLLLVPSMLRRARPDLVISLRLPTPWPAPELFARLPWRAALLAGASGADVISLPAERDRKNLARSFGRYAEGVGVAARKGTLLLEDGRRARTIANAPGLDVAATLESGLATDLEEESALWRERLGDRDLVLTVGRPQASSGLLEQLAAIERLLARRRELAEQLAFVVVASDAPEGSSETRRHIESDVGRINGRFTLPGGGVPVQYLQGGVSVHGLAALYRLARVLVVTPLLAAASLEVKEFVVFQHDAGGYGRALLSETSGTAVELPSSHVCNPFDLDAIAGGIVDALERDPIEAQRELAAMAGRVRRHDVHTWWRRERSFAEDPRADDPGGGAAASA